MFLTFQIIEEWIFFLPPFLSSGSCANSLACDCGSTTLKTSELCQEKSTGKQKAKAWPGSPVPRGTGQRERERKKEKSDSFIAYSDSIPGQKETQAFVVFSKEGSKGIRAISSLLNHDFLEGRWLYLQHQLLVLYLLKILSSQVAGKLKT